MEKNQTQRGKKLHRIIMFIFAIALYVLKQNNFSTSKINYGKDSFISSFKKITFMATNFIQKSREDGL